METPKEHPMPLPDRELLDATPASVALLITEINMGSGDAGERKRRLRDLLKTVRVMRRSERRQALLHKLADDSQMAPR